MERRTFLGLSAGALTLAARFLHAQETPAAKTLRKAGAAKGILVGAAVGRGSLDDPDMARLIGDQFSILVSENDMKWLATQPERDRYDFSHADDLIAFAESHDQRVRGHNLCWHQDNPKWLEAALTPQNAATILEDHVRTVAGHYAGRIHSWDVVNEAVLPEDGRKDRLRKSIWLQMIGPEYLEVAYRTAAEADPKARLTYNDYGLERDNPGHGRRRKAVLELLRWFRKKDIPLHAVGIQSHLTASLVPPTWKGLNHFLNQVQDLGLDVYVTEMDVEDLELPGDIPARDRMVADLYRNYLEDVLKHPSVKAVLTWGFTDKYSWLNRSRHQRPDNLPKRPLPFDADLRPTPAFDAMIEALEKG
ncbi:MAG: endo-1,4-beta-xylanase [Candidatus Acidiferrales bacterium]